MILMIWNTLQVLVLPDAADTTMLTDTRTGAETVAVRSL
jgi:hypothetical protein